MSNRKECQLVLDGTEIVLPEARLLYAYNVFRPRPNKSGAIRYQAQIMMSPDIDLAVLKNEMLSVAMQHVKAKNKREAAIEEVQKRFVPVPEFDKKGTISDQFGDEFENWVVFKPGGANFFPNIIQKNGKAVPPIDFDPHDYKNLTPDQKKLLAEYEKEVYSNRTVRISVSYPEWFNVDINKGVTCYFRRMQLLEDNEPIKGSGDGLTQTHDVFGVDEQEPSDYVESNPSEKEELNDDLPW